MIRDHAIPHFEHVDLPNVRSRFFDKRSHRAYLKIPFVGDRGVRTLCVIGQNPSAADEYAADKTIRYLEELIFVRFEDYGKLVVLNLYSQVDTAKIKGTPPLHPECSKIFERIVNDESDFLVVFGKLTNKEPYRFQDRAREVAPLFRSKLVFKLDQNTSYAPHPGNQKIIYRNFDIGVVPYRFEDVGGIVGRCSG